MTSRYLEYLNQHTRRLKRTVGTPPADGAGEFFFLLVGVGGVTMMTHAQNKKNTTPN